MATNIHDRTMRILLDIVTRDELKTPTKLYQILRLVAKYRSHLIGNTLIRGGGLTVRSGPFAGMTMDTVVPTVVSASSIFSPVIFLLLTSLFAALYPAIKAARLNPIQAIYQR